MTLEKAIEILDLIADQRITIILVSDRLAMRLSIKALERFRDLREAGIDVGMPLLYGETRA